MYCEVGVGVLGVGSPESPAQSNICMLAFVFVAVRIELLIRWFRFQPELLLELRNKFDSDAKAARHQQRR